MGRLLRASRSHMRRFAHIVRVRGLQVTTWTVYQNLKSFSREINIPDDFLVAIPPPSPDHIIGRERGPSIRDTAVNEHTARDERETKYLLDGLRHHAELLHGQRMGDGG